MMVSVGPGRGLEPALATLIAAVSLTPSLVAVRVAVAGLITTDATDATDATGALDTVTVAVALFPPLVAVIVTKPAAAPETKPLAVTVATAVSPLAQVTV